MSWFGAITGLLRPAKEIVEVFKPNAEAQEQRGHAERMALSEQDLASLQEFAAEFQARAERTWLMERMVRHDKLHNLERVS